MKKRYTVGCKVPSRNNSLHMTLAFIGSCNENKLETIKKEINKLNKILPLKVKYGGYDYFGSKKDVKVRRCHIEDKDKMEMIMEFYRNYFCPNGNNWYSNTEPQLHVSVKDVDDEINQNEYFITNEIFLKEVGPHDPIYVINLKSENIDDNNNKNIY